MMNKKYGFFILAGRSIGMYFRAAKWFGILEQTLAILHSFSWAIGIVATQLLFDAAFRASGGNESFWYIAAPLLILAIVAIAQQVLNGAENFIANEVSYKNQGQFMAKLQRKLQRVPAQNFENTAFLDDVNKAREGAAEVAELAWISLQFFTFYVVFFATVGVYLFLLSPMLLIVLFISFIPAIIGQYFHVKIFTKLEEENAPMRRRYEYYQKAIADREFYKETRILGAFRYFHALFSQTMLVVTKKIWRTERKMAVIMLLLNVATFIGLGISTYLLFTNTMTGIISIGAFAAVFAALNHIFGIMDELLIWNLGGITKNIGKAANYMRVMDMEEVDGADGTPDFSKGIVAENISFSYPGREECAVKNLSLTINPRETIAIVGENGAGKSTLVRILTGIYRPDSGTVTIGGLNSTKTQPNAIFNGISGVFQRYQRYKMTLAENVAISDTAITQNNTEINNAISYAEFNEDNANLETMLSPEFDGIDLSGGQWQRLAIARGLYRKNNFIVLDEPTAAIDPIEEARIYNQFKQLAKDKCAVVVTHRLGSAKLADRIVVMDNGVIVGLGTHSELISKDGKYADMWTAQVTWYENRS
ncbi:MAG: ABC transporter ATP-binding protein/permease [Defluviitaleaceae bacterium]|nr:ABC transporter ATP-binding protein/permease [Defluviitaleaceae bacterium]